jgi:hypothetical protein
MSSHGELYRAPQKALRNSSHLTRSKLVEVFQRCWDNSRVDLSRFRVKAGQGEDGDRYLDLNLLESRTVLSFLKTVRLIGSFVGSQSEFNQSPRWQIFVKRFTMSTIACWEFLSLFIADIQWVVTKSSHSDVRSSLAMSQFCSRICTSIRWWRHTKISQIWARTSRGHKNVKIWEQETGTSILWPAILWEYGEDRQRVSSRRIWTWKLHESVNFCHQSFQSRQENCRAKTESDQKVMPV